MGRVTEWQRALLSLHLVSKARAGSSYRIDDSLTFDSLHLSMLDGNEGVLSSGWDEQRRKERENRERVSTTTYALSVWHEAKLK
jgi:hypothetical protein